MSVQPTLINKIGYIVGILPKLAESISIINFYRKFPPDFMLLITMYVPFSTEIEKITFELST